MSGRVVVLTGGVGGAKLAQGLAAILPPRDLTAVVNTGDDFRHFGLAISPDIDTLLYTLSGRSDTLRGWGRAASSKVTGWPCWHATRTVSPRCALPWRGWAIRAARIWRSTMPLTRRPGTAPYCSVPHARSR